MDGSGFTHLALLDAGVNGVEQVRPVFVALGSSASSFPSSSPCGSPSSFSKAGLTYCEWEVGMVRTGCCVPAEHLSGHRKRALGQRSLMWLLDVPEPQWAGSLLTSNALTLPSQHPGPSGTWKKFFSSKNSKKPYLLVPGCNGPYSSPTAHEIRKTRKKKRTHKN